MKRSASWLLALGIAVAGVAADSSGFDAAYVEAIEQYRSEREERLRDDRGWLTLAGLFWLEPGDNRFGSDPNNEIVLTTGDAPPLAGTLIYEGEDVRLIAAPGARITIDGEPVRDRVLAADTQEATDVLELGRLNLHVIKRGNRHGIRVRDPEHPRRASFGGLDFFPLSVDYRFDAEFKPFEEPRPMNIVTVVGTTVSMLAPGVVEFSHAGKTYSLHPVVNDAEDTELWFIFKDETSGKETYGFRYLWADLEDGRVDLDFNRAYNPPCAFSPYATCPLPPKENRPDVRIEAGERAFYGD